MKELLLRVLPGLNEQQCAQLEAYYALLVEWNARMNLTAITEAEAVVQKHFADSALPIDRIPQNSTLIDVGTGAGFPGLVIRILRPDVQLTLLDSLNKRVTFLETVCAALGFGDVRCIHARAEDGARTALRESFDVATARAVASTDMLAEWLIPYLKVGGKALLYKGPQAAQELREAQRAFSLLHCTAQAIPYGAQWGERCVVELVKTAPTGKFYPRKAGTKEKL